MYRNIFEFPTLFFHNIIFCDYLPFFPNQKIGLSKNELSQKGALYKKNQKYSEDVKVQCAIFFNICTRLCLGARIFKSMKIVPSFFSVKTLTIFSLNSAHT